RSGVQEIDGPAKGVKEPVKRTRYKKRDAFGTGQAQTLGNELAEYHLQDREQSKHDDERGTVGHDGGPWSHHFFNHWPEKRRQCDLSQISKREAGNGDADLHARHDPTEIPEELFDDLGARIALFHKLTNARKPDGNEREFGRGKKCVYAD